MLRTSVSGMNSQAVRLGSVSENIANSSTNGYKQSQVEFSSLLGSSNGEFRSDTVQANVRRLVSEQGSVTATGNNTSSSKVDLAINGTGFLVVTDGDGGYFLTRAGSFTKQADGSMVNAAGYTLVGYPADSQTAAAPALNSFVGLEPINLGTALLSSNPTTEGILTVPLNDTFVPGTAATFTQTGAFKVTGGTSTPGDKITFDLAIDGGTALPIEVVSTATSAGLSSLTAQDFANAINAQAPGVASVDKSGKLVVRSNTDEIGTDSSIAISNIALVQGGTAPFPTAPTFTGFDATPATAPTGTVAFRPTDNTADTVGSNSTISTSITVYNNSGEAIKLDIYYTKTAKNTWEMAVFDSRTAAVGTSTAPFPYGGSGTDPIAQATLNFDGTTFQLARISDVQGGASASVQDAGRNIFNIDLSSIGGSTNFALDLSNTTQYTGTTQPLEAKVNGNPAQVIDKITISAEGLVTATFDSGTSVDLYKIPLAKVESPDSLLSVAGNAYSIGQASGGVLLGYGGSGGFGDLVHGSLEESTVDLASELTTMIESQRSYTANSKVFQTGSEILDVLVNLKR